MLRRRGWDRLVWEVWEIIWLWRVVLDMYTVRSAALTLGVSLSTMRRWIAESGVGKSIETDRTRVYITYDDLALLAFKHGRKMEQEAKRDKALQEQEEQEGDKLYSIVDTARLLNVSVATVKVWLSQSRVEKKVIITDRKRVYISYRDIVLLAHKHSIPDRVNKEEKVFYTIEDVTLFFGVTSATVRRWMRGAHVRGKITETKCAYCRKTKRRVSLSSDDVRLLAELYKPAMSSVDVSAYIRDIKSNLAQIKR